MVSITVLETLPHSRDGHTRCLVHCCRCELNPAEYLNSYKIYCERKDDILQWFHFTVGACCSGNAVN